MARSAFKQERTSLWEINGTSAAAKYRQERPFLWEIKATSAAAESNQPNLRGGSYEWEKSKDTPSAKELDPHAVCPKWLKSLSSGLGKMANVQQNGSSASSLSRSSTDIIMTREEKLRLVMADNTQWMKLRRSLQDECGGCVTNSNLQIASVLDELVENRLHEMEQLELALEEAKTMRESNVEEKDKEEKSRFQKSMVKAVGALFSGGDGASSSGRGSPKPPKLVKETSSRGTMAFASIGEKKDTEILDLRPGVRRGSDRFVYGWDDNYTSSSFRSSHDGSQRSLLGDQGSQRNLISIRESKDD